MNSEKMKSELLQFNSIQNKMLTSVNGSVYHYCTLDTLWKILESNSLLATHVEFSNDTEEYNLGKKLFAELLNKSSEDDFEQLNSNSHFMVCFCEKKDLLSQWREYARNGVCIEFDFNRLSLFEIRSLKEEKDSDHFEVSLNEPKKVIYFDDKENEEGRKIYNELQEKIKTLENPIESSLSLIPYVKHKGFEEEKEARFIFTNINKQWQHLISYLDRKGMRVPVLKIKPFFEKTDEFIIYSNFKIDGIDKILVDDDSGKKEYKIHLCSSSEYGRMVKPEDKRCSDTNEYCLNCFLVNKQKKTIFICGGSNMQLQEMIYNSINKVLREQDLRDVEVEVEGILPIKRIMIGPCKQQNEIKRGVEEFLQSYFYWSKVKVDKSKIPYRSEKSDLV